MVSIYIYGEPAAPTLLVEELARYVKSKLPGLTVEVRPGFVLHHLSRFGEDKRQEVISRLARDVARARVRDLACNLICDGVADGPVQGFEPLAGEIEYEKKRLTNPGTKAFGILYDGFRLANILRELIPDSELSRKHIHIVFTNQLFGTWDGGDRRYHARVSVYGFPSLISTSGIVEAPAKPREYYLIKQRYAALGMTDLATVRLGQEYDGTFVRHDDERLTEIMKGYIMQAVFYHLMGNPFCQDSNCRLYNAHWQEEVIKAQLTSPYEFCKRHEKILREWGINH